MFLNIKLLILHILHSFLYKTRIRIHYLEGFWRVKWRNCTLCESNSPGWHLPTQVCDLSPCFTPMHPVAGSSYSTIVISMSFPLNRIYTIGFNPQCPASGPTLHTYVHGPAIRSVKSQILRPHEWLTVLTARCQLSEFQIHMSNTHWIAPSHHLQIP